MSRREFCKACSFARYGIKSRIEHTCDGTNIPESPKHEYIPTREELNNYLAKLKELMEPGSEPYKPKNMNNTNIPFPRRNRIDLMTAAELAIRNAVIEVEKVGADIKLTEAVMLLTQAQDKVADYVDEN